VIIEEEHMKSRVKTKKRSILAIVAVLGVIMLFTSPALAWKSQEPETAAAWEKMMGFKAPDVVGKIAPEIKPGLVIDSNNYKQFPGLKELLPKSLYDRLDPNSYAPLAPIKIVKTDQYHLGAGYIKKSLLSAKTSKIGADGLTLEGYQGGFPFIHPKNGVEQIQLADNAYLGDTFAMRPMRLRLYNSKNRPERELRQNLNFLRYSELTDWREKDIEPNPNNAVYITAGVFIYPRDLSGTSYVRTRYKGAGNPDQFLLYIPSMRRIRRLSGRDTQDPLFGSDLVWDDYNIFWQKVSTKEFPNEYKIVKKTEMLLPTFVDYNWPDDRASAGYKGYKIDESGDQMFVHFGSWQRRPVTILEVNSLDDAYVYSKRHIVFDNETGLTLQTDCYDQAGRLWRSWVRDYNLAQKGAGVMEDIIDIVDHLNQHRTVLDFKGHRNPKWMGVEYADVRFLSKKSK
jgi:hypothetical protein